jgi:glycerol kinase
MQIQADALGIEVVRPKNAEATVLGAAYLAGLAVGYWPGKEAIASQWQMDRVFKPAIEPEQRRKVRATWSRALERAKQWAREEEKQA